MKRFVKKYGIIIAAILLPTAVALLVINREIIITGNGAGSENLSRLEKGGLKNSVLSFVKIKELDGSLFSAVGSRIVTAYTVGRLEENDDRPCEGAYGQDLCQMVERGYVVFATNEFKKGTLLKVGDVVGIVLDRTNSRYQHRVDVAMRSYAQARAFGIKTLQVYYYEYTTEGSYRVSGQSAGK